MFSAIDRSLLSLFLSLLRNNRRPRRPFLLLMVFFWQTSPMWKGHDFDGQSTWIIEQMFCILICPRGWDNVWRFPSHPSGFEGKFCEEQFNACDSMVCHNGGSCLIAHDGRAHCSCPSGYVGLHCEEELTGCDSSPCVHGICVDQTHGYRCFCQPGLIIYYLLFCGEPPGQVIS